MTIEWRKSSRSNVTNTSECVEIARISTATGVRDSKAPDLGVLTFDTREWRAFVEAVKSGGLDLPR